MSGYAAWKAAQRKARRTPIERMRDRLLRDSGFVDIEPGGELINEFGKRSTDAQDIEFARENADGAREILRHPELTKQQREIWRLTIEDATYSEIAEKVGCSFRAVSASIDRAHALMLCPQWEQYEMAKNEKRGRGRPPTIHLHGVDGLTKCGKSVEKNRYATATREPNCAACGVAKVARAKAVRAVKAAAAPAKRRGRPPGRKRAMEAIPDMPGEAMIGFAPLDIPAEPMSAVEFTDLETSIAFGVQNAHKKIVEIHQHGGALTSAHVADNERAVHTLLSVRKSELEYIKAGNVPGKGAPASDEKVREAIGESAGKALMSTAANQTSQQ